MGTDVHIVIEVKDAHSDEWVGIYGSNNLFNPPYTAKEARPLYMLGDRDYDFFGVIAGVRRAGPEARGLPDDISSMARMYSRVWGDDAHSHSYLPLKDFIRLKIATSPILTTRAAEIKLRGGDPIEWMLGPYGSELIHSGIENYRVVFWFDN